MSRIIKPQQTGIIVPKQFIKEEIDRQHRLDWEDPDRYQRQKQKALRYIPARAPDVKQFAWERLVRETARVFHDDLVLDPDIKEAAQRACWAAEQQHRRDVELEIAMPMAADTPERGEVRGVDDSDATLLRLEQQLRDETES